MSTEVEQHHQPLRRRRPRLGIVGGAAVSERHASALELFFDLVFVVAVAELAETLQHHPTPLGALQYAGLFVAVWWAWVGYTFFADRIEDDNDVIHRIVMIMAMLAVTSLAVAVPVAFESPAGAVRFSVSYVAVRVLLMVLYVRVHVYDANARPLTIRYLTGFSLGASVWLVSVFVSEPGRYWLWALGLLIELSTPLLSASAIVKVPFHVSHIPERFGLFVIIVLGEAVTLDAIGIASADVSPNLLAIAACGFLIAAAMWWLYFDCVDTSPMRRWRLSGQVYVYGHLAVFAAITAFGVGVLLGCRSIDDAELVPAARWGICAGVGAFMMAIGLIHLANRFPRGDVRAWSRLGVGLVFILLAVVGERLPLLALEAIVLAGVAAQTALELRVLYVPKGIHHAQPVSPGEEADDSVAAD